LAPSSVTVNDEVTLLLIICEPTLASTLFVAGTTTLFTAATATGKVTVTSVRSRTPA